MKLNQNGLPAKLLWYFLMNQVDREPPEGAEAGEDRP